MKRPVLAVFWPNLAASLAPHQNRGQLGHVVGVGLEYFFSHTSLSHTKGVNINKAMKSSIEDRRWAAFKLEKDSGFNSMGFSSCKKRQYVVQIL